MWPASSCKATMSERRSAMLPPEMTNGSTRGSVSSNSSARAMRVIVICLPVSDPYTDPQTKWDHDHQSRHREERPAPIRRDQPCHRANGESQHHHLEVGALDLLALWQP